MMKKMIAVGLMGMGFRRGAGLRGGARWWLEETSAVSGELNNNLLFDAGHQHDQGLFGGRDGHRVGPLGYAERSPGFR